MKRLLICVAMFSAMAVLGGCVAVPYNAAYGDPYGTVYPTQPGYGYGSAYVDPPVYVGPPVYFGFGLNYRSGGHGFRGRH